MLSFSGCFQFSAVLNTVCPCWGQSTALPATAPLRVGTDRLTALPVGGLFRSVGCHFPTVPPPPAIYGHRIRGSCAFVMLSLCVTVVVRVCETPLSSSVLLFHPSSPSPFFLRFGCGFECVSSVDKTLCTVYEFIFSYHLII